MQYIEERPNNDPSQDPNREPGRNPHPDNEYPGHGDDKEERPRFKKGSKTLVYPGSALCKIKSY